MISLGLFLFSIFPWVLGLASWIFAPNLFLQKIPSKVVQQSVLPYTLDVLNFFHSRMPGRGLKVCGGGGGGVQTHFSDQP